MAPIYLGVDGGGTKTLAVLVHNGTIIGQGLSGSASHEADGGYPRALATIQEALDAAFNQAGVPRDQVSNAVLGIAGADFPEDFEALHEGLRGYFGTVPYRVVNDAEVALVGGARSGTGIVVICGTGTNVWGLTADGRSRHIGGNGYEYGDWGGGIDLARAVLHYAFRSYQARGKKTKLESAVLDALGYHDYDELTRALYLRMEPYRFLTLAPLCFRVAREGDMVAQEILRTMGRALAESAVGCASALGSTGATIEVVMAGSVWLGDAPHLIGTFKDTLADALPFADAHFPDLAPVAGAALLAAQDLGEDPIFWRDALRQFQVMRDSGD